MTDRMTPEQFRAERSRLNMTIKEMAEYIGLSTRAVSYYESGQRPVPLTIKKFLVGMAKLDKKYEALEREMQRNDSRTV